MGENLVTITSNMLDEAASDLAGWVENMKHLSNNGIIVVDGGSTDGTEQILKDLGIIVIVDDIIQREGYGPARNHLRQLTAEFFPDSEWMCFFDADERILEEDWHTFRYLKDYVRPEFNDVIAFPRIDWFDREMTKSNNDIHVTPDYQARMTRMDSQLAYIRKLHEQIVNSKGFYSKLTNPKIQHFNRCAGPDKRKFIGKVCAMLHMADTEHGESYPMHKKEQLYRDLLKKEGL